MRDFKPTQYANRLQDFSSEIHFPSFAFHSFSLLQPPFVSSVLALTFFPFSSRALLLFGCSFPFSYYFLRLQYS